MIMNLSKYKTAQFLSILLIVGLLLVSVPSSKVLAEDTTSTLISPSAPVPTFDDVPATHWAFQYVEDFYAAGMTTGCNYPPFQYCPERLVTRAETAVFMLRSINGGSYQPAAASGTFSDVPVAGKEWMEPWIEEFYSKGITTGCSSDPLGYCPERTVTRAELAVFALRAKYGQSYQPPSVVDSSFSDVPVAGKEWMMPWIEEFYKEGLTTGCYQTPTLQFCPERGLTRAEMATFLVRAFHIGDTRGVAPEDFSVMDVSGVVGYNVGFHLVDATYADAADVTVKLYKGATLLATNTATDKFFADFASGTIQSSPFDVLGTFDYVADGYWTNTGWAGNTSDIPDKAEITVTFKGGLVRTATNTLLTGDTSIFTKGDVVAQDFGVFNGPEVIGYTVGFGLTDAKVSDTTGIVVKLYNGTTELASATSTAKIYADFPDEIQLSAPFDVLGTFDYVADGYWDYSKWGAATSVIPDKAEITITFKNGLVKTATNTLLTGDTSIFTKGDVVAQDFGVYVNEAVNLKGYSVGFGLVDAVASDASGVIVNLYKGETVLATATSTGLLASYPTATSLSAPFAVVDGFDYAADGNWSYSGWLGNGYDIPDKAEITVTFKNGLVKTATNTNLTGDTLLFDLRITDIHIESDNPIPTEAKLGDTITLSFTTNQPVTKLNSFKINGSNPNSYTNVGNEYTATHLVDEGDAITGSPVTFQINVMNGTGVVSQTLEATSDGSSVTIVEPIGAIDYYSGIDFARSVVPGSSSVGTRAAEQTLNSDGSVTISVTSADNEYIDSGFVKSIGTLGELESITIRGTGDFSFNLYFDIDKDGQFFLWNEDNSFANVGLDRYALFEGPYVLPLFANGASSFGLIGGSPYVNTLDQLKAIFPADTPIGIWVGVTRGGEPAGTKTATISSVTVTTIP